MDYNGPGNSLTIRIAIVILLTASIVLCAVYDAGILAVAVLALLLIYAIRGLWKHIRYPIEQVQYFLLSLRCGERMIRFPKSRDSVLNDMYGQMNDIIKLYYSNKVEIETKKDYYDRILRIMTHEIRNTVTPIISLSEHYMQNSGTLSPEEIKEGLAIINTQSSNIKSFLDSYHTLTHLPEPEFRSVDTAELFNDAWQLLQGENGGERIEVLCTNVRIKADPVQMQLLIINMLRNAMQAIEGYPDGKIEVRASISNKQPFISISDNGCGIPPEKIDCIFQPFYTTKKNGSGIGLSLCRQIMLLHGGELTVESNPQKRSTTFLMTFPATE